MNNFPFFMKIKYSFWITLHLKKCNYIGPCESHPHRGINPFMPTVAFNICCPRDCVSRHDGGTVGAPLKPLRDDSALRALSSLRGLRGAPEVPPLCRETQSLGQQMLNATVGINGLKCSPLLHACSISCRFLWSTSRFTRLTYAPFCFVFNFIIFCYVDSVLRIAFLAMQL